MNASADALAFGDGFERILYFSQVNIVNANGSGYLLGLPR